MIDRIRYKSRINGIAAKRKRTNKTSEIPMSKNRN
ncbi:MAG: hypothetical protein ACJASF_000629 [Vicingaceae bacterium]|jgi:hypothetical protein